MTTYDRDIARSDAAFERALIESAKADAPHADATDRAWTKLTSALAIAAASGNAGEPRASRMQDGANGASSTASSRGAAWKWVVAGAIGGSALTAAWLHATGPAEIRAVDRAPVAPAAASPSATLPLVAWEGHVLEKSGAGHASAAPSSTSPPARREKLRRTESRSSLPPSRTSTLAAEVALLDVVRAKMAIRAFRDAWSVIDQYRRDFPGGELAREADVLEIEIWDASGDRENAAAAASRFLERYPSDPHAPRVRRIGQ